MKYLLLSRDGSHFTSETKVELAALTGAVTFNLATRKAYIKGVTSPLSYLPEYTESEFFKDASLAALVILVRDCGYTLYAKA